MIFAADPHPVATYVAGCSLLVAMFGLSVWVIAREISGKPHRIWHEFAGNFAPIGRRVAGIWRAFGATFRQAPTHD